MKKLFFSLVLGTIIAICWVMIIHTLKWIAIRGNEFELLSQQQQQQMQLSLQQAAHLHQNSQDLPLDHRDTSATFANLNQMDHNGFEAGSGGGGGGTGESPASGSGGGGGGDGASDSMLFVSRRAARSPLTAPPTPTINTGATQGQQVVGGLAKPSGSGSGDNFNFVASKSSATTATAAGDNNNELASGNQLAGNGRQIPVASWSSSLSFSLNSSSSGSISDGRSGNNDPRIPANDNNNNNVNFNDRKQDLDSAAQVQRVAETPKTTTPTVATRWTEGLGDGGQSANNGLDLGSNKGVSLNTNANITITITPGHRSTRAAATTTTPPYDNDQEDNDDSSSMDQPRSQPPKVGASISHQAPSSTMSTSTNAQRQQQSRYRIAGNRRPEAQVGAARHRLPTSSQKTTTTSPLPVLPELSEDGSPLAPSPSAQAASSFSVLSKEPPTVGGQQEPPPQGDGAEVSDNMEPQQPGEMLDDAASRGKGAAGGVQTGGGLVEQRTGSPTPMASLVYRAPFFTSWFVSIWNILFMPVFTLISSCCFRNEDNTTKKLLVESISQFMDNGLTTMQFLGRCAFFSLLWIGTIFGIVYSLSNIDATVVMALFACSAALVYLLSWVLLHQQFVGVRIVAVIICTTGIALLAYMDNSRTLGSVLIVAGSALCSAVYKVIYQRMFGFWSIAQMSLFFTLIGLFNAFLMWPVALLLYFLGVELIVWRYIPWVHLTAAGALHLTANIVAYFGPICSYDIFLTMGLLLAVVLSAGMKLAGIVLLMIGFLVCLLPENWNEFLYDLLNERFVRWKKERSLKKSRNKVQDLSTGQMSRLRTPSGRVK